MQKTDTLLMLIWLSAYEIWWAHIWRYIVSFVHALMGRYSMYWSGRNRIDCHIMSKTIIFFSTLFFAIYCFIWDTQKHIIHSKKSILYLPVYIFTINAIIRTHFDIEWKNYSLILLVKMEQSTKMDRI